MINTKLETDWAGLLFLLILKSRFTRYNLTSLLWKRVSVMLSIFVITITIAIIMVNSRLS